MGNKIDFGMIFALSIFGFLVISAIWGIWTIESMFYDANVACHNQSPKLNDIPVCGELGSYTTDCCRTYDGKLKFNR